MTPMPVNPKIVLSINVDGLIEANANNIGNDLEIVMTFGKTEFEEAARGIPYKGTAVLVGQEKS